MDVYAKYKGLMRSSYIALLKDILESEIMDSIRTRLTQDLGEGKIICPKVENIYNAFNQHEVRNLKVVILGQDPYHTVNLNGFVANGLAFSTNDPNYQPPSLLNLRKKIDESKPTKFDTETLSLNHAEAWGVRQAVQGVLLLNTALTTLKGEPNVHKELWKEFTEKVIETIAEKKPDLVWILMGSNAIEYLPLIKDKNKKVIITSHPSPLSSYKPCGNYPAFNDVNIFKEANDALEEKINW